MKMFTMKQYNLSTSALVIATQLAFTAIFAFLLVKQKFTAYSVNAVMMLILGAAVLALQGGGDRLNGESRKKYVMGFVMTLLASLLCGFIMPLVELVYKKTKQDITYSILLAIVGMIIAKDFKKMATHVNRKASAAPVPAHTKKPNTKSSFPSARAYQAIRPPPPKIIGSSDGPPVTAPRIKLRDGRNLAYKEHGVPKDEAKYKIISILGFDSCRHDEVVAKYLSSDVVKDLRIYIVSFDRPGYGESDPNPNLTVKSLALDVEELADKLGLGSKFYIIGYSMGGQITWGCLKYIPHRLAGAALLAPAVNYWWHGFPTNLSKKSFSEQKIQDQWTYRIAHYTPWLTHWWNTQQWFPSSSIIAESIDMLSPQDLQLIHKLADRETYQAYIRQQGEYETVHRDLNFLFHNWEFSPLDLENPFPNNEGSVHIWQGDEDLFVATKLQPYIAKKLPWIHYHELAGAGHMFPYADGMSDIIIKSLLQGK